MPDPLFCDSCGTSIADQEKRYKTRSGDILCGACASERRRPNATASQSAPSIPPQQGTHRQDATSKPPMSMGAKIGIGLGILVALGVIGQMVGTSQSGSDIKNTKAATNPSSSGSSSTVFNIGYELTDLGSTSSESMGFITVKGRMKNTGRRAIEMGSVTVTLYDGAGNFLGTADGFLEVQNLPPGGISTFTAMAEAIPGYQKYSISVTAGLASDAVKIVKGT